MSNKFGCPSHSGCDMWPHGTLRSIMCGPWAVLFHKCPCSCAYN